MSSIKKDKVKGEIKSYKWVDLCLISNQGKRAEHRDLYKQ